MMSIDFGIKLMWIAGGILVLSLLAALWRADRLSGELAVERAARKAAQAALDGAVAKGLEWKAAYETALSAAGARAEAARACLERAEEAEAARREREAILRSAPARERTETEKRGVVDDATRGRAADRLNRVW